MFNCSKTAFYQAYPTLVQNLLSTLGTQNQANLFPTAYISIDSAALYSGILSSLCSAKNSPCTNTEINNINKLIKSATIAGLQVLSSSMTPSNGSSTQNCQPPCATCTIVGGNVCVTCLLGYTNVQNSCVPLSCPVPYCSSCSSGGNCIQCLPTFTLVNNACLCRTGFTPSAINNPNAYCMCSVGINSTSSSTLCKFCNIDYCQACSSSNTCQTCFSGYNMSNSNYSCVYCQPNCNLCITSGYCSNCSNNLNVSTNGSCVLCYNVTIGCVQCSADNICGYCQDGYSPVLNNASQIIQCVNCSLPYCSQCNTTNVCNLCYSGYIVNNGTCVSSMLAQLNCQLPCVQCTINGQCLQCLSGLYSSIPNNGTCFMCMVSNCFICSYSNPSNCTQCLQNYTILQGNLGGYCQLGASYGCLNISSNGTCLQCNPYYSMQNNGTCLQCSTSVQGCTACSPNLTTCTACQSGMYLIDNQCMMCSIFCLTCNSSSCITQNPQIYIGTNYQAVYSPCYMPCIQCSPSSSHICLACTLGFILQNNTSVACGTSGCKYCGSNTVQCQACFNYQLLTFSFNCMPCTANCLSCSFTQSNCTMILPAQLYLFYLLIRFLKFLRYKYFSFSKINLIRKD